MPGVPDYENMPISAWKQCLKQIPGQKFDIINYGVPGYAMVQHLEILRQMVKDNKVPDFIILDATSNCDMKQILPDNREKKAAKSLFGKNPAGTYSLARFKIFFKPSLEPN